MTPGEWTPARLALLRAEYASAEDNRALLDRINALDGAPIASVKSLGLKASKLGLMKTASAMAAIWALAARPGERTPRRASLAWPPSSLRWCFSAVVVRPRVSGRRPRSRRNPRSSSSRQTIPASGATSERGR